MTWHCKDCPFTTRYATAAITHVFYIHFQQAKPIPTLNFYSGALDINWYWHNN